MKFPDPESADSRGLVCVGGDLSPETLESAYSRGIFPWPLARTYESSNGSAVPAREVFPQETICFEQVHGVVPAHGVFPDPQQRPVGAKDQLLWFCPPRRGILFFEEFKIPKSTQKLFRKKVFELTLNREFGQVIKNCAEVPRGEGTWILPGIIEAYKELHRRQKAISVEAWCQGELVGGLYGVLMKGVFSGESMFFKKSGASKLCLVYLVEYLKSLGHRWMDIQMVTSVTRQFGGRLIPRKKFLNLIKDRQKEWRESDRESIE